MRNSIKALALLFAVVAISSVGLVLATPAAQQPAPTRKILLKKDSPAPSYEQVLALVDFPPHSREGRHTHPGSAMVYVLEGTLTLDRDGKPTATYKPGDSAYIEPGQIHEGRNLADTPAKVIATFLLQKGLPMTSQVQ